MSSPIATAFGMEESQGISLRSIKQKVKYTDLVTSGVTASPTMTLSQRLPAYSLPIGVKIETLVGFAGDTTAAMGVGLASVVAPTGITDSTTGCIDYDVISGSATYSVLTAGLNYCKFADFADALLDVQDSSQDGADGTATVVAANENYIMITITGTSAPLTNLTAGEARITVYFLSTLEGGGNS